MDSAVDPGDPEQRRRWSGADRMVRRGIAVLSGNPVSIPGRTELNRAEYRLVAASVLAGDVDAAEIHARRHIHRARRYMALDDNKEPA
jgi:hypothetical protein